MEKKIIEQRPEALFNCAKYKIQKEISFLVESVGDNVIRLKDLKKGLHDLACSPDLALSFYLFIFIFIYLLIY